MSAEQLLCNPLRFHLLNAPLGAASVETEFITHVDIQLLLIFLAVKTRVFSLKKTETQALPSPCYLFLYKRLPALSIKEKCNCV